MAIDFTGTYGVFTKIGLIGGFISDINIFQTALVNVKSPTLVDRFTSNGKTKLVLGYIPAIDSQISSVSELIPNVFIDVAEAALIDAVTAHDPLIPPTVTDCLLELVSQMEKESPPVRIRKLLPSVGSISGDITKSIINVAMVNPDGGYNQHALAEIVRLELTSDSFTGGASIGNETYTVITKGEATGVFNYDYPSGSGSSINIDRVNRNASGSEGNSITNGNFNLFDALTPTIPSDWSAVTGFGVAGTHWLISADGVKLQNLASIQLKQEVSAYISAKKVYNVHFRFKLNAPGAQATGAITVDLIDSVNNTLLSNTGDSLARSVLFNSITTGNLGVYQDVNATFVVGSKTPGTVFLRIMCEGTNETGVTVELNRLVLTEMYQLYTGGPYISILGLNSEPVYKGERVNISITKPLDIGSGTIPYTNNTFQVLFNRLFSTADKGITLPNSTVPTVSDALIL